MDISHLVDQISALPRDWHGAGTVTDVVLRAIVTHAEPIGPINNSIETGTGKTTLLFSHLSKQHLVFTIDTGSSLTQVKNSPLFNAQSTKFVYGPTQRTMPNYTFTAINQIVLIDGPHGYPFPDLEYYYLYPTIEKDGLLLIDDIRIPTIGRMFDILRAGDLFELLEIVDNNMAFFQRTATPLINPEGDDWWLQAYNYSYARAFMPDLPEPAHFRDQSPLNSSASSLQKMLLWLSRNMPVFIKNLIPTGIKTALRNKT